MQSQAAAVGLALLLVSQTVLGQTPTAQCDRSARGGFAVGPEVEVTYQVKFKDDLATIQSVVVGRGVGNPGLDILALDAVQRVTAADGTVISEDPVPVRYDAERKLLYFYQDSVSLGKHNALLLRGVGGRVSVAGLLTVDPAVRIEGVCREESSDFRQRLFEHLRTVPEIAAFLRGADGLDQVGGA